MSIDEWMDEESVDLPPEAGTEGVRGFEPDDDWLTSADTPLQKEVLRRWFTTRYWDPANETPYISEEGGYLFVWGGPYDAGDELHGRFSGLVPEDVIDEVVEDLQRDGIYEWAPIHTEPDYDEAFELAAFVRGDPFRNFAAKLTEIDGLKALNPGDHLRPAMLQLLYSSLIAALEAYLAETMAYWIAEDDGVFRKFIEHSREFKEKKLSVSEIFARMETLKDEVEKHLQSLVWHRLDVVAPMLSGSLGVKIPEIGTLMKRILIRHDIVHRGGKTKEGKPVSVSDADLDSLRKEIEAFVNSIEQDIDRSHPPSPADF